MAVRLLRQKVAVPMGKVAECVIVWTCQVLRSFNSRYFAWQAWHFVACGPVTDARLWWHKVAVPMGKVAKDVIFVVCFVRIALARLREVATKCKFHGRRGIL